MSRAKALSAPNTPTPLPQDLPLVITQATTTLHPALTPGQRIPPSPFQAPDSPCPFQGGRRVCSPPGSPQGACLLEDTESEPGAAVEGRRAGRADPHSAPEPGPGRTPGGNSDPQGAATVAVVTRVGESGLQAVPGHCTSQVRTPPLISLEPSPQPCPWPPMPPFPTRRNRGSEQRRDARKAAPAAGGGGTRRGPPAAGRAPRLLPDRPSSAPPQSRAPASPPPRGAPGRGLPVSAGRGPRDPGDPGRGWGREEVQGSPPAPPLPSRPSVLGEVGAPGAERLRDTPLPRLQTCKLPGMEGKLGKGVGPVEEEGKLGRGVRVVAFWSVATARRALVPGLGKSGRLGGGVGGQLRVIRLAPPVPVLGLEGNSLQVSRVPWGVSETGQTGPEGGTWGRGLHPDGCPVTGPLFSKGWQTDRGSNHHFSIFELPPGECWLGREWF